MLTANPNWDAATAKLQKRPLYIVIIENLATRLATFRLEDMSVTVTGYGMTGYGLSGYGY